MSALMEMVARMEAESANLVKFDYNSFKNEFTTSIQEYEIELEDVFIDKNKEDLLRSESIFLNKSHVAYAINKGIIKGILQQIGNDSTLTNLQYLSANNKDLLIKQRDEYIELIKKISQRISDLDKEDNPRYVNIQGILTQQINKLIDVLNRGIDA